MKSFRVVRLFALGLFLAAGAPESLAQCVDSAASFVRVDFPTGANPVGIALADFNQDSLPDALTIDAGASTATLLLGDGTGSLGVPLPSALLAVPSELAVGDFDSDGRLDLLVTQRAAGQAEVLRGTAGAGFASHAAVAVPGELWDAKFADMNGDGRLDLVSSSRAAQLLEIRTGDGSQFTLSSSTALSIPAGRVGIADFNVDGDLDALVLAHTPFSSIWKMTTVSGDGVGGTSGLITTNLFGGPRQAEIAELNHDGRPDVVVSTAYQGSLDHEVRFGHVAGGFGIADYIAISDFGPFVLPDLDSDGKRDDVATGYNGVKWYFGFPDGEFPFNPGATQTLASQPTALAAADMDFDGDPDIAAACGAAGVVSLLATTTTINSVNITWYEPLQLPVFQNPPAEVHLKGAGLDCLTSVKLGTTSLTWTLSQQNSASITLPTVCPLGTFALELQNPYGSQSLPFTGLVNDPPKIGFKGTNSFTSTTGADVVLAGTPGLTMVLLVSSDKWPTTIPGLFTIDIGLDGQALWWVDTVALPPSAAEQRHYALPPFLPFSPHLYIQALVIDPTQVVFPLPATNYVGGFYST
jgi:FG-GAP-like repeat